jgi:asparagine synthase (glutamine-hydrolysing)
VSEDDRLGLSLSGGLDARTILGVIDHDRVEVTTVTLGIEGSSDHRYSEELARRAGCRHHNHVLDDGFLSEFETHFRRMVLLTDGQYLSQAIVMPTLALYRELGIEVLLRGHAGELMHMTKAYNFSLDRRALGLRTEGELDAWVLSRLRAYIVEGLDRPLWAAGHAAGMDGLARESLRACLAELPGTESPPQRIARLFLTQRVRRESALSLVKFGSVVQPRLPYLDNDLVELLLACPVGLKLGETIQGHILRRHRPEMLDVPNVNTGTYIGAGPLVRRLASLKQRVLARLRVRGYQPYERMGLWLRRELQPLVERLLLDDRCLQRGIFDPDSVRRIVTRHIQNRRNHTFLILAMMVYELGQRELVDEPVRAER